MREETSDRGGDRDWSHREIAGLSLNVSQRDGSARAFATNVIETPSGFAMRELKNRGDTPVELAPLMARIASKFCASCAGDRGRLATTSAFTTRSTRG